MYNYTVNQIRIIQKGGVFLVDCVLLAGMFDYVRRVLGSYLWNLIVFIFYVLVALFVVYPLLKYLICRIKTWSVCKFKINNLKNKNRQEFYR